MERLSKTCQHVGRGLATGACGHTHATKTARSQGRLGCDPTRVGDVQMRIGMHTGDVVVGNRLGVAGEQEWPVRVFYVDFILNRGSLMQKFFALLRTY